MRLPASGRSPAADASIEPALDAISLGSAMRPIPRSPASAISPLPGPITTMPSSMSCARFRRVAGCAHMRGFIAGAISILQSVASEHGGCQIVGMAIRHLCHQVGGRRCHHDQVGLACEPDMADVDLGRGIEQVSEHPPAGQGAGRERRDELLRGGGEDAADGQVRARSAVG